PSAANRRHIARPIPLAPPVTTTTLSLISMQEKIILTCIVCPSKGFGSAGFSAGWGIEHARDGVKNHMTDFAIGVDLGGTNLRIAAVDSGGKVLEKITSGTEV